jgi:hypothetical protein
LRFASSTACSAFVALALAACGASETEEAARPAELPAEVGALLASETQEVTAALERGDPATARAEAVELRAVTVDAIGSGRVPRSLRAPLLAAVERLVASIEVPAAPPSPPPAEEQDEEGADDEDDGGKGDGKGDEKGKKGKGKGKGKDKGGDDR